MTTQIEVLLTLHSPLHIGSEARNNTSADRPLLKLRDGLPYIPATSLKGCLRHQLEALVLPTSGTLPIALAPDAENMSQPLSPTTPINIIDKLFGSPWIEGCLRFGNLTIDNAQRQRLLAPRGGARPTTVERMGVGINARRRVARDEVLYSTELFAPGLPLIFTGTITSLTDDPNELGLVYGGLRLIERIGGSRSRGLGWCKIAVAFDPPLSEEQLRSGLEYNFQGQTS